MRRRPLFYGEVWNLSLFLPTIVLLLGKLVFSEHRNTVELALPLIVLAFSFLMGLLITTEPASFSVRLGKRSLIQEGIAVVTICALVIYQPSARFSGLWHGFGVLVAITSIGVLFIALRLQSTTRSIGRLQSTAVPFCAFILAFVYTPSFAQPPWGFINLGDASHQVLEEIAGPLVGHFPGVNFVSTYTTLLGTPLLLVRPLSLSPSIQMSVVVLWVNVLTFAVPVLMINGARISLQTRRWVLPAFLVCAPLMASGPWGSAASNVESLSMIPGRTILPVILGDQLIRLAMRKETRRIMLVGMLCILTAYNNLEFGAPAAVSAALTLMLFGCVSSEWRRVVRGLIAGVALGCGLLTAYSLLVRGSFDVWFRIGSYAGKPYSPENILPLWSTHNLLLALFMVAIGVGLSQRNLYQPASVLGIYFGAWGLLSFPYCSYRCESELYMSTQVYFVPAIMCAFAIYGMYRTASKSRKRQGVQTEKTSMIPLLLCSLAVASVVQAPNPLDEWRRVLGRADDVPWAMAEDRALPNRYDINRIDWIDTKSIISLAKKFDSSEVGYFGHMGNSVELATGVNNLTRINSAEVLQIKGTSKLRDLACREVDEARTPNIIVVGIDFPCSDYVLVGEAITHTGVQLFRRSIP